VSGAGEGLTRSGGRTSSAALRAWGPVAIVFLASLLATVRMCRAMQGGMSMPGGWTMSMAWMRMPGQSRVAAATMFLGMWLAMMIAMMLPSAAPRFLGCRESGPAAAVACGYFAVWIAVGVAIYPVGVAWASAVMAWPALSRAAPVLTGLMLVLAGALQFGRSKAAALSHCRDAAGCRPLEDGRPPGAGFVLGIRQGLACVRCCAGLMLALLALGLMNLAAMTAVAAVISLEKLLPRPGLVVRVAGVASIAAGLVLVARSLA
jgi:predicted metal-binding membrane protein